MEKLIVLVDGSVYSASVCEHAAWAAGRTGAAVEVLHVMGRREGPASRDLSGSIKLGARTALLNELAEVDARRGKLLLARGRAILEDARAILDGAGVTEITTRLRQGDIVETVAELEPGAAMIMVGKRGEAADFAKAPLGSNLERIVRASTVPVFVAARAFKPVKKVLVAWDGRASAMKAVDHIARSALFAGLTVEVVTVGTSSPEVLRGLESARAMLRAAGIEATAQVIPGAPETALGKLVDEAGFDMLVMGAYGHSRIRTLVIGSTTSEMLRSCKVPVLLLR